MNKNAGALIRGLAFIIDIWFPLAFCMSITSLCFYNVNIEHYFTWYLTISLGISFVMIFGSEPLIHTTFGKFIVGLQIEPVE